MKVNNESGQPSQSGYRRPNPPRRRANPAARNVGRPHVSGTRLAKIMRERGIKVHDVGRVLLCSDRTVYNYLTRRYPIPALQLGALCDRLDTDPLELIDDQGYLLEESEEGEGGERRR